MEIAPEAGLTVSLACWAPMFDFMFMVAEAALPERPVLGAEATAEGIRPTLLATAVVVKS